MDVVWKGLLGGFVTALIGLASKRGNILPGTCL
jgi:membrane protein GlpM